MLVSYLSTVAPHAENRVCCLFANRLAALVKSVNAEAHKVQLCMETSDD